MAHSRHRDPESAEGKLVVTAAQNERWTKYNEFRYNFVYLFDKVRLLFEVRQPKVAFLLFEFKYSISNFINTFWPGKAKPVLYYGPEVIETQIGKFTVRRGSHDAAIISPAFERGDVQQLYQLLDQELAAETSVGFLDIGANIGAFTVRVAAYTKNRSIKIWSFEPHPANLLMLESNLKLNRISQEQAHVFGLALSDRDGESQIVFSDAHPGDSSLVASDTTKLGETIQVRRADGLLPEMPEILIVKLDVEGHERQVLEGMREVLRKTKRCWLCLEDVFEREALWEFVESLGFKFHKKVTPYNSWWLLE